jgi:hypothetical protein
MKSENSASPAADEEVIELTDIVKSGPEAEEAIIDLTDPIETVKAEPHDAELPPSETQPLELGENLASDDELELVDLTDPLAKPAAELAAGADPADGSDTPPPDTAEAATELLDLEAALMDDTVEPLELDLSDAFDAPQDEEMALDLDKAHEGDEDVLDFSQAVAGPDEVPGENSEVLDLADVLDAAESENGFLELDEPATEVTDSEALPLIEEALEVIEDTPVEVAGTEVAGEDDALSDEALLEDLSEDPSIVEDEDSVLVLETPQPGEIGRHEFGSMDDELAGPDMADSGEADESQPVLDLVEAVEAKAESPDEPTDADADDGDDLEFKLDEMLAEAQADMPDLEDDETDLELDLSEALADAAAENSGDPQEAVLDLDDPLAPAAMTDDEAEDGEDYDLISDDKIIDLDDITGIEENTAYEAAVPDNVIALADITGGYPTVTAQEVEEIDAETIKAEPVADEAAGAAASAAADAGIDADADTEAALDGGELDIDMDLDDEAAVLETELNPEMKELEATLDDVFQDEDGDGEDLDLGMFADDTEPDDDEAETLVLTDAAETDLADADMAGEDADAPIDAAALGTAALGATAAGATAALAGEFDTGEQRGDISPETLDAAVERVIKTMYADRIEQMVLDVIKEAVTAEIEKVKRSLSD